MGFHGGHLSGGLLATAYIFRFFSRAFGYVPESVICGEVPRRMEWSALALALGLTATPVLELLHAGVPLAGSLGTGGRP